MSAAYRPTTLPAEAPADRLVDHPRSMHATAASGKPRGKAIVIGAGFGGLAAAVRLGAMGYAVTVVERLPLPGGRARVFEQDGFRFDAGPTIITAPFLFEELWSLAGRRLEQDVRLKAMDPFYRVQFNDGSWFDYGGDSDRMRREIEKFSAADLAGYDRFRQVTRELCDIGFVQLGHQPFEHFGDLLSQAPALVRLQAWRSLHGLVARYIRDPRLRMVFSFHPLLVGGNPFTTTAVYGLINELEQRWGVHYVMGGTHELVRGLQQLIESLGGEIRTATEVKRIEVEGQRATGVRLASGERLQADVVVSNADADWTYRELVPPEARRHWSAGRLRRLKPSMSLFVWYFGTRIQYPDVLHHTILMGPRYRELIDDIFKRRKLADDFSLYLHRPSATDPTVAPDGCDAFYALVPVPNLAAGIDWQQQAEPFRLRIQRRLEETLLPGLGDQLISSRLLTPQDFRDDYLSSHGAGFGPQPLLSQSAWFRPHNRSEELHNLYLVGAGTHPGAGVPGVLSSARVLDHYLKPEYLHAPVHT